MMKVSKTMKKTLMYGAVILAPVLWGTESLAGVLSLSLVRSSLTNVADAAGLWQYEGGDVKKGATLIGQYAITRRITTPATSTLNTAMETVTLFFTAANTAPNNVTMAGAHSFSSGRFTGSVSAASNRFNWIQGADAVIAPTATLSTSTLSLSWTGASQLTLP